MSLPNIWILNLNEANRECARMACRMHEKIHSESMAATSGSWIRRWQILKTTTSFRHDVRRIVSAPEPVRTRWSQLTFVRSRAHIIILSARAPLFVRSLVCRFDLFFFSFSLLPRKSYSSATHSTSIRRRSVDVVVILFICVRLCADGSVFRYRPQWLSFSPKHTNNRHTDSSRRCEPYWTTNALRHGPRTLF